MRQRIDHVVTAPDDRHQVPTALLDPVLLQPPLRQRAIIRRHNLQIEPSAPQLIDHHKRNRIDRRGVDTVQQHDLLPLVPRLLQHRPRLLRARLPQIRIPNIGAVRTAAQEDRLAKRQVHVLRQPHPRQNLLLVQRDLQRPAHAHVVERRYQIIHRQPAGGLRVSRHRQNLDARITAHLLDIIERQDFHVIHRARFQRGHPPGRVGNTDELNCIETSNLPARKPVCRFRSRLIGRIAMKNRPIPRPPFPPIERKRPGTDCLNDCLGRRRRRHPHRHHHRQQRVGLSQSFNHKSERPRQHDLERAVVDHPHFRGCRNHPLAESIHLRPALGSPSPSSISDRALATRYS